MAVAKEIVMTTNCPGCFNEGRENFLKNKMGDSVTYCTSSDGFTRQHVYDDTGILRGEISKMEKAKKLQAKRDAEAAPPPPPVEEPISTKEPKAFEITEVDAGRLAELLGQEIDNAGSLVGAVYALKNTTVQVQDQAVRQSVSPETVDIQQRLDGTLAQQVFLPWPVASAMVDKANFNGVSVRFFVQGIFENLASANYFGGSDVPDYPPVDPRTDGIWILVEIPEMYVGTTIDRTRTMGTTPQKYLQDFIFNAIDQEQFT